MDKKTKVILQSINEAVLSEMNSRSIPVEDLELLIKKSNESLAPIDFPKIKGFENFETTTFRGLKLVKSNFYLDSVRIISEFKSNELSAFFLEYKLVNGKVEIRGFE